MPSTLPADKSYPAFRGTMEPDLYFFGFDLTVDQLTGQAADGTTTTGHYIVIQEQPTEPRFGLDVGTDTGAAMPPAPGRRSAARCAAAGAELGA